MVDHEGYTRCDVCRLRYAPGQPVGRALATRVRFSSPARCVKTEVRGKILESGPFACAAPTRDRILEMTNAHEWTFRQAELSTVPGLDMIPQQWLHLTMQGVGFVEHVPTVQVDALLAAARSRIAEVEPVKVRFRRPVIRPEAIALTPDPVQPVQEIRNAVRGAIADVLGPDEMPDSADGYQPHISLAYVSTPQPAIAALDAINRVTAGPADLTIDAVSLIEMHRDNRMYEWQTIGTVPLGHSG